MRGKKGRQWPSAEDINENASGVGAFNFSLSCF